MMQKHSNKLSMISTLAFVVSGLFLVASFSSLMLSEKFSAVPFNLFYIGVLCFCLACALEFRNIVKFINRKYYWIGPRQLIRFATLTFIAIILMILSFQRHILYDWTAQKFYSLSNQNIKFLESRNFEITMVASRSQHRDFFETMQRFSNSLISQVPKLRINWLDPVTQPSIIEKLKLRTLPCMIVHEDKPESNRIILGKSRLMPRDFSKQNRLRFLGEPALIQALVQLKNRHKLNIVFLAKTASYKATKETALLDESPAGYAALKDVLEQDGFEVVSSENMIETSNPMIVFLPLNRVNENIEKSLSNRASKSLPTLLMFESQPQNPIPNLSQKYDVKFLLYPLIDHMRKFKNDLTLIAPFYQKHELTAGLSSRSEPVILQGASAFQINTGSALLQSSRISWLETDLSRLQGPQFDNGKDIKGPLKLMIEQPKGTLWISDQDFISNRYLGLPGNRSFLLHIAHFLSGQLDLISERGKTLEERYLSSVQRTNRQFIVLLLLVMPSLCFLLAASLAWLKSRE